MAGSNLEALQGLLEPMNGVDLVPLRDFAAGKASEPPEELAGAVTMMFSLFEPDADFDMSPLGFPGIGSFDGHAGITEFWRKVLGAWEELRWYTTNFEQIGDNVLYDVSMRGKSRALGAEVEGALHTQVWSMRDGRVYRARAFPDRKLAVAAAAQDA